MCFMYYGKHKYTILNFSKNKLISRYTALAVNTSLPMNGRQFIIRPVSTQFNCFYFQNGLVTFLLSQN